ncbi:MAG: hypothetical protein DCC71_08280 [Proteobacteria bacterium]|nr:MAG: hypothetical protein DCC71_08280 [Pseudomonadota bacterium]
MADAEELQRQRVLERRFRAMGLDAGVLPGGRAVIATLPVGPEPFDAPDGSRVLRALRFYTVGHDRIKCVAPRALFHLPPIRITDCAKAEEIEARIRSEWSARIRKLRDARRWLADLGIEADAPQGAPLWSIPLGLEDERACAAVVEPGRVILPSRGPLSGLVLPQPEERVFEPRSPGGSGTELLIDVTVRLEELARRKRNATMRRDDTSCDLPAPRSLRVAPLLLVGTGLAAARPLHESLRLRGFDVRCVTSSASAIDAFRSQSFGMVLAETRLDRADGIELVPALRALPGILDLPVVLLDERPSPPRRVAAKAAGASGYLSGVLDPSKLAGALAQLAVERKRRRFSRYERALSVSWPDCDTPAVTAQIGRLGCLLRGAAAAPIHGRYSLHLPETGETLRVDAEVSYRQGEDAAWGATAVGLRFGGFEPGAEAAWIDYVCALAPSRAVASS